MTADIYNRGDALVLRLLDKYGVDMPLVRTNPDGSILNTKVRAAVINPQSYITHPSTLDPTDERIVCDSQVEPQLTDKITKPNGTFVVFRVDVIQPADKVMGYRAELRRA